jgi:putative Ca2+/H+ antiporter (TMEM165/GDT1 family)
MAFWSFIVTLAITIINPELILALSTKLFLIFVLWFLISDRKVRQRLRFYKIRGVSNLKFFTVLYLIKGFI